MALIIRSNLMMWNICIKQTNIKQTGMTFPDDKRNRKITRIYFRIDILVRRLHELQIFFMICMIITTRHS